MPHIDPCIRKKTEQRGAQESMEVNISQVYVNIVVLALVP